MNPLQPLSVQAPGFYGLNKQQSATTLDSNWATDAENCVIDETGRIAARNGFSQVTDTPISGSPDIEQLFEWVDASGTSVIISAANSKLYSGTTTLTEKTGSVTITDDNWKFQNFNGNLVGYQSGHDPIFKDGSGNFTKLLLEHTAWTSTTAKSLKAAVRATSDNNLYFEVTSSGTTGGSEPTWNTTIGGETTDNDITWTTRSLGQSDEALAAYGRVWTTDGTVIHYTDLLIPWDNNGASGGSIDLKSVWVYGIDQVVALAAFNGNLIIFGEHSITVYSGADDPSNMVLVEQIQGIGCIARDSIQDIGTDILFLSDTGIRSLQRSIQNGSMPFNDVSRNNRDYLMSFVRSENKALIRSVYHEPDAFYLLTIPTLGFTFCFDTRRPLEDGSLRTTTWTSIDPKAMISTRNDKLYLGKAGLIGEYSTYLDNATTYLMLYRSSWNNQESNQIKIAKKIRAIVAGGYGYAVNFYWAFDYNDAGFSSQSAVRTNANIAEYGIAEYGIAEYSGGSLLATVEVHANRSGEYLQFGWNVTIDQQPISFQKVDLYFKLGRYNR